MKFPIKYKLASIILVILLPMSFFSVSHYFAMVEQEKANIASRNATTAGEVAKEIDGLIAGTFGVLNALAKHPSVPAKHSPECDKLFAELLPANPGHLNILAAGMDGYNYGSGVPSPGVRQLNYLDKEWFQRASAGTPAVGNLHISKLFKSPAVMIAMPVFNNERKQVGVVGIPLDLSKIQAGLRQSRSLPPGSDITVIDAKGRVLASLGTQERIGDDMSNLSIVKLAFEKKTGSEEDDGTGRLYGFAPLASANWMVIAGIPVEKAYHHAYALSRSYIVMLLVVSAAALALSLAFSGRISRSVASLVATMRKQEQGDSEFRLTLGGHDELTEVAKSFGRMIAARNEADQRLRESESFLSSVLEGIGEGVVVIDKDYRIVSANRGYCAQMKLSCDDVLGKHCYYVSHHINEPCYEKENGCDCTVQKCFESDGHHQAVHTHYDMYGNPVYIETHSYPLKDPAGNVVSAIETLKDITEKRNLEAQLLQAQKMEAVGLLAGGVAHDFNNILTAIIGYGNLVQLKMKKNDPMRAHIEQILAASERAAGLTQSLLAFSRKQIINPKPLRLGDIIARLEKLLSRVIGEDIEMKIAVAPGETAVMADAGQIEQILMNLCTNARDAMQEGGTLMIETERVEFDEDYVRKHAFAKPGAYMLLSVSDTGQGMDERTRSKIFEPFFTTKELGRGTGLGLAIVYGVVKQHNGYINVYSEPGKGTTFRLYFPAVETAAETLSAPVHHTIIEGTETVLLAEDEPAVRNLAKTILEEYGYKIILAEDGEDALTKFKASPGAIDLLVLDVMMPKKNGKEVYEEIRGIRPDIKALFMSGYTANVIHKKGILNPDKELIIKPFSPHAFLQKVRQILDA
jgi:PAS domain S-box-containing protein